MSEEHVATSGPKAREMVEVVLGEFDRWAKHAPAQAVGIVGGGHTDRDMRIAQEVLYDVRTNLDDHLVIAVGVTLASWGVDDE